MFVSTSRQVVYPQSEHARLAGTIAQYWGNEQFSRPDLPFDAFCTGVALHDFGYGLLDNSDILSMGAKERHRTFESLMHMQFANVISEVVAKTHVARLMNMAGVTDLEAKCRQQLSDLIAGTGISEGIFQQADTITRLCDSVAFDFCFERPATGNLPIFAEQCPLKNVEMCYEIDFKGTESSDGVTSTVGCIRLTPWPLSESCIKGYLLAYEQSGYPQELRPHRVEFELRPGS